MEESHEIDSVFGNAGCAHCRRIRGRSRPKRNHPALPVDITGFLSTTAKNPKAGRALLDYFKSPEAAPVWEEAKAFPVR